MRLQNSEHAIAAGVGLMLIGTLCASGADAALKAVASDYASPQILFIAALLSLALTLAANRGAPLRQVVHTGAPWAMAVRSGATIIAAIGFYQAFVRLSFSEVFLFIGIMPLLAAVLSGPILGEKAGVRSWVVLGLGLCGMVLLVPYNYSTSDLTGHLFAAMGSIAGTVSVVLARHIGRHDTHSLAQVFIPQASLAVVMAAFLPFVLRPMTLADVGLVLLYALLLFCGRWIMVIVSRLIPAWLSLQLLNLQFVWMVALGFFVFSERTEANVMLGAGLVILAGVVLARDEIVKVRPESPKRRSANWQEAIREGVAQVRVASGSGR